MLFVMEKRGQLSPTDQYIAKALYRKAVAKSWEYRKVALHLSAQYSYRVSDVRKIMETGFQWEEWEAGHLPEDCKSEDFDERLVVHSDLSRAYDFLTDHYQSVLYRRYYLNYDQPAASLRKALERLTDILNHYQLKTGHVGTGTRRVVSNARAQLQINADYNGSDTIVTRL